MKRRVVFVDIRNKLVNESSLFKCFDELDIIISLTPYSNYLLDKSKIDYILFSDLKSSEVFISDVIADYHRIAANFVKFELEKYQFLFRDIGKFITFEHYLRAVQSAIKENTSVYISNVTDISRFGKNAPLSDFLDFSYEITLKSDEKFYKKNRFKIFVSKIKPREIYKSLRKKYMKQSLYVYDNAINADDYKEIKTTFKYSAENLVSYKKVLKVIESVTLNNHVEAILHDELSTLLSPQDVGSKYIPFIFLNGASMYSRFLMYKENNIPAIFMQHGSYVHENYFLKYNEVTSADINLVFNEYTKELFENLGSKKTYSVGTKNYNEALKYKKKEFDFVYITYCTAYSFSGFYVGSKDNVISPTAENIFNRHKEIIDLFGNQFPEKMICIKVQPGVFTGQQLYIPLKEHSEKYSNITIVFDESLHNLIEKSKYILSDYFSSEFSNRKILTDKDIIMFTDIIKLPNIRTKEELDKIFFLVDDFTKINDLIANIDSKSKKKIKPQEIIDKYSSANLDTKSIVCRIISEKLEKEYHY